ncbi:MAG: D-glycero-beta-D-manno-heptose-1,7-bisphosphate 7-phosphatase [Deltaproteobacteria bacterium]|nr:D-glycero-beta-D-manno-heptose-1,7-bisphosphate 7-phosphatase [Deltaproteobacteria bacterium]
MTDTSAFGSWLRSRPRGSPSPSKRIRPPPVCASRFPHRSERWTSSAARRPTRVIPPPVQPAPLPGRLPRRRSPRPPAEEPASCITPASPFSIPDRPYSRGRLRRASTPSWPRSSRLWATARWRPNYLRRRRPSIRQRADAKCPWARTRWSSSAWVHARPDARSRVSFRSGAAAHLPRLVLLDRDGVINQDRADYVRCAADWVPIPGALEAIAALEAAGCRVAVVTNQSGLGRGLFDRAALDAIHEKMRDAVASHGGRIDACFFCPHVPEDDCECRKPRPGLLREALRRFDVPPARALMVGDREVDLVAARAAGCAAVLVQSGQGRADDVAFAVEHAIPVRSDLGAAVRDLLAGDFEQALG